MAGRKANANLPVRNMIFRRLPAEEALAIATGGRHRLRQIFTRADLVAVGFGVMIGAGIFRVAGEQAEADATAGSPG